MAKLLKDALLEYLEQSDPQGHHRSVARLMDAWPTVVGEEIAEMAFFLGHKERVLYLGCTEAAAMQEIGFMAFYILDQTNSFLGRSAFDKIHVDLICNKIQSGQSGNSASAATDGTERPEHLGGLMEVLPPDTPVGRAYRAYVNFFEKKHLPEATNSAK